MKNRIFAVFLAAVLGMVPAAASGEELTSGTGYEEECRENDLLLIPEEESLDSGAPEYSGSGLLPEEQDPAGTVVEDETAVQETQDAGSEEEIPEEPLLLTEEETGETGGPGKVQKGFVTLSNGKTIYYNRFGNQLFGWLELDGYKYYFDLKTGYMSEGWRYIGQDRYYFGLQGRMFKGFHTIMGKNYLFTKNGVLIINQKKYYYLGKYYKMDKDGVMTELIKPAAPSIRSIESRSYNSVTLSWNGVSNTTCYRIYYRSSKADPWTFVSFATGTSFTHVSSGSLPLVTGSTYFYTVSASNNGLESDYDTAGRSVKVKLSKPLINSMESVHYDEMKLGWSKVSGADGFQVFIKKDGSWKLLGESTVRSFTHKSSTTFPIQVGVKNTYTVRAYRLVNGNRVYGEYSTNGSSARTFPDTVELLEGQYNGKNAITIRWKKAGGATHYGIFRKMSDGSWKQVTLIEGAGKVGYSQVSSSAFPITSGQSYTYTVRAYNADQKIWGSYDKRGITVRTVPPASATQTELDAEVNRFIQSCTTSTMTRYQKLLACFNKIQTYEYVGWKYPDTTQSKWWITCARDFLKEKQGNCYGLACSFAACAKALGYKPYVIVLPKIHSFVRIDGKYWDNIKKETPGMPSPYLPYTEDQAILF